MVTRGVTVVEERGSIGAAAPVLLGTARAVAHVDVACALGDRAVQHRYVRPALTDETALFQLRALQVALLHWAADHVSEPDLPMKETLAWIATHRFGVRTQAAVLVERIARIVHLVPAGDAEDRKYTAH